MVRDYNGKPIHDAHVIFHPIEGDKDKGALELKTNDDGKAIIDVIPVGDTVTPQVIADGFQTYGQDYKIDKPNMSMEVRMKRPVQQYSIYKNSTPDSGAPAQPDPPVESQVATPPPAQAQVMRSANLVSPHPFERCRRKGGNRLTLPTACDSLN